jgi:uncharacterized heparinase superfamily protein
MAPRPIDDDAVLVEIAIEHINNPDTKFAPSFRAVAARATVHVHSDDSARKRLQRKFSQRKEYWMMRGQQELEARREAQLQRLYAQIALYAEHMRPMYEAANKVMERYRPVIEAAAVQFNSPEWRNAIAEHQRVLSRVKHFL